MAWRQYSRNDNILKSDEYSRFGKFCDRSIKRLFVSWWGFLQWKVRNSLEDFNAHACVGLVCIKLLEAMSDSEELSFTQGSFSWLLGRSFSAVGFPLWIKEVRLPARMLRRKRAVLFHFYTPEERNMLRGMCSILLLLISTVASAPLSPVITTLQTVYKSGGLCRVYIPLTEQRQPSPWLSNKKISRRHLADYVKKVHQKACRTCSTIIFPYWTNQIIDLWLNGCLCRSVLRFFNIYCKSCPKTKGTTTFRACSKPERLTKTHSLPFETLLKRSAP